jgi:hypothetical protein
MKSQESKVLGQMGNLKQEQEKAQRFQASEWTKVEQSYGLEMLVTRLHSERHLDELLEML